MGLLSLKLCDFYRFVEFKDDLVEIEGKQMETLLIEQELNIKIVPDQKV